MKIGHFQCECKAGDYEANFKQVIEGLQQAKAEGVKIVSFPESLLTGYFDIAEKAHKFSMRIEGPEIEDLLKCTASFDSTFMVGFNELRGNDLFNTVLVAERGHLLGCYSKAFPCFDYFTPGRDFPIFERDGLKFGIVICADGGYIEPTRILAIKGAQIVFAPHYNYIRPADLINHFQKVRNDHIARAVENDIWFFRGNSVTMSQDTGISHSGVGYGDSYLLDPHGEIVIRTQRHIECFIYADINIAHEARKRSQISLQALGQMVISLVDETGN